MKIESHFKTYTVEFTENLNALFALSQNANTYFVIDKNIQNLYTKELPEFEENRVFFVDAKEQFKTVETALEIAEKMTAMSSKRNTHLVSVGGGIIQDITGFVANVLYRGIEWTFYPSTLLAACDSCIG